MSVPGSVSMATPYRGDGLLGFVRDASDKRCGGVLFGDQSTASPAQTAGNSRGRRGRPLAELGRGRIVDVGSDSRPCQTSVTLLRRVRAGYAPATANRGRRRGAPPGGVVGARGDDRLRLASASISASWVASNRVPMTAPAAPSTNAAASPRPSAMPPAASTGAEPAMSTTAGTNGNVARPPPCPPASEPCATMMSAPTSSALTGLRHRGHLNDDRDFPAARTHR